MPYAILVLDDDADYRRLLKYHFAKLGVVVHEAGTGKAATTALQCERIDLAIVDGLLPDTDGMRWIRAVRDSGRDTPIVFVSSFFRDIESHRRLTNELGVLRVIQKPMGPQTSLVDELQALVVQRARGPAPAVPLARGTDQRVPTTRRDAPAADLQVARVDGEHVIELHDDDLLVEAE